MENNKQEMIFVEGMSFKPRAENAPETVRGGIYFKYPEFARFMEKHKNDKGWVNVKMMKSKEKGSIYFILDTWKPTSTPEQQAETQTYNDNKYKVTEEQSFEQMGSGLASKAAMNLSDIPF
jgi:hypothetical protein